MPLSILQRNRSGWLKCCSEEIPPKLKKSQATSFFFGNVWFGGKISPQDAKFYCFSSKQTCLGLSIKGVELILLNEKLFNAQRFEAFQLAMVKS